MKNKCLSPNFFYGKRFVGISIFSVFLLAGPDVSAEVDCSPSGMKFFLDNGFSHDHIVQLCGAGSATSTSPVPVPVGNAVSSRAGNHSSGSGFDDEVLYFNRVIFADQVQVTPEQLSFTRKECFEYGEEDITGFRDAICARVKTEIQRKGLKLLKASRRMPFIKDTECLVEGSISQVVLNESDLDEKQLKILGQVMDRHPKALDIPLREGSDPEKAAERLIQK